MFELDEIWLINDIMEISHAPLRHIKTRNHKNFVKIRENKKNEFYLFIRLLNSHKLTENIIWNGEQKSEFSR